MTTAFKKNLLSKKLAVSLSTGLILTMVGFMASAANAAPIYKVVDSKTGQITFTDSPQNYEQQAGKQISQTSISTGSISNTNSSSSRNSSSNTTNSNVATTDNTLNAQSVTALPDLPAIAVQTNYQLAMIEPSAERAYRRPAQSIEVLLQTQPALQAGDTVSIYLDDRVVAQGLKASITTVDILPGEHSIRAIITNKQGQALQQVMRTVYVIQNTARLQNNKKIANQLLAYQNLSWPQKALLKLRRDKPNNLSSK